MTCTPNFAILIKKSIFFQTKKFFFYSKLKNKDRR